LNHRLVNAEPAAKNDRVETLFRSIDVFRLAPILAALYGTTAMLNADGGSAL
jgi:hypothetical protein